MSKILKLNSYSQYDELGDRDYMVYEVKYKYGHKEYVSRDVFRNLKALEIIKSTNVPVFFIKRHTYKEYLESPFSQYKKEFLSEEEYDLLKEELE